MSEEANFAYDDAFKTMEMESDELVLPLLNEMFGEHYSGKEAIRRNANEHFIEQGAGAEERRATDSLLCVEKDGVVKKYHIECERSADGSLLARFFEYDTQIALDESTYSSYRLTLDFPHSGVLFLRSSQAVPDEMTVEIKTPGGNVAYSVKVMRVSDYTVDDIFEKKLYFLIPFYIFNIEKELKQYNDNGERLKELKRMYQDILDRLEVVVEKEQLAEFSEGLIRELSSRVAAKVASKYENVKESIGDLMGGRVLDTRVGRARNEGIQQGIQQGERKKQSEMIFGMLKRGKTAEEIADFTGISLADIEMVKQSNLQPV